MTISVSVQWNSHYLPALQKALWTSAQRPQFRKQWLEPSRDIKECLPALNTDFMPGPFPPAVFSCSCLYLWTNFNFTWERKLIWSEREEGSKHIWVCHASGLLSPKMFRLNKGKFIDSAHSNETKRRKYNETKQKSVPRAEQTQNAHSRGWFVEHPTPGAAATMPRCCQKLILQQLHYHLHVTSVILHLLIDICHCLITNDD